VPLPQYDEDVLMRRRRRGVSQHPVPLPQYDEEEEGRVSTLCLYLSMMRRC
jgi:hypothetical protein